MNQPVTVVTAGASGIGEACGRLFAQRGRKVVLADIDETRMRMIAGEISCACVPMDVTRCVAVEAAIVQVERIGPIEALVHYAGISHPPHRPESLEDATVDRVIDVNLRGSWFVATAVGTAMRKRGSGSIVLVASIVGMRSFPLHAYGPTKAATLNLTENLAGEWGSCGIRVNAISPGLTNTPLVQAQARDHGKDVSLIVNETALRRMVEPSEVAAVAAYLISSDASAITGVNIPVDAGWLAAMSWHGYGGLQVTDRPAP